MFHYTTLETTMTTWLLPDSGYRCRGTQALNADSNFSQADLT